MTSRTRSTAGRVTETEKRRLKAREIKIQDETILRAHRDFDRKFQVYHTGSELLPYRVKKGESRNVIKWGQRKLLMETIQFFTLYWDPVKHPDPVCLYIGAAPGCSVNIMTTLFPQIEWHLFDSSPFNRKLPGEDKKVYRYNRYFDSEGHDDIKKWKNKSSVFLLSDIRNPRYDLCKDGTRRPIVKSDQPRLNEYDCEKMVIQDMLLQEKWVYQIDPVAASLKFRLPWFQGFYREESSKMFPYLQGHVYYQPWIGQSSTETRLVPMKNKEGRYFSVNWDVQRYESALFFHNSVERNTYRYINPFTGGEDHIDGMRLTNDWDSLCETQILMDYLTKIRVNVSQENVQKLSRYITNTLLDIGKCGNMTLEELRFSITKPSPLEEVEPGMVKIPMEEA